jgi:ankyrin repeat protein
MVFKNEKEMTVTDFIDSDDKEILELVNASKGYYIKRAILFNTILSLRPNQFEQQAIRLLEKGIHVNHINENGMSPLRRACWHGNKEWVDLLLKERAQVNAKGSNDYTALHGAAEIGAVDIIQVLLKAKADVNAKTARDGQTPIYRALCAFQWERGNKEAVDILIKAGADMQARTSLGTPEEFMRRLQENGKFF